MVMMEIQSRKRIHLQLHALGHLADSLSDTKIREDVLRTTKDGIEGHRAVVVLDVLTHTSPGDTTTTEDLDSVCSSDLGELGRGHLEETNGSGEVLGLLLVRHVVHLVGDVLEPRLDGLAAGDHASKLASDDGLRVERLAESLALRSPPSEEW